MQPAILTATNGMTRLEVETWGPATAPTVLLLAGTSCTRDWWRPAFCERLADAGYRAVRFDQRDTGASTTWPVGEPDYSLDDLAADALAILDRVGADRAHLVGFSQGGWVAQLLALGHPQRVASLTLVSTRATGHGPSDPDLPEVTESLLASWEAQQEPEGDDVDAVVASYVEGERALAGADFDAAAVEAMCREAVLRSTDVRAAANHPAMKAGTRWRERLGEIAVPTTVIHGTADPLFPVGNAHALAREIPGARLELRDGVGHEFPERAWDNVLRALRRHRDAVDSATSD